MPGTFTEVEEQSESAEQEREDLPSWHLLKLLQEDQNQASRETVNLPNTLEGTDNLNLQALSRSGGRRSGRWCLDRLDTANIIEGRQQTCPWKDQADYQAYTAIEALFIKEPERVEYAFAIVLNTAEESKK